MRTLILFVLNLIIYKVQAQQHQSFEVAVSMQDAYATRVSKTVILSGAKHSEVFPEPVKRVTFCRHYHPLDE